MNEEIHVILKNILNDENKNYLSLFGFDDYDKNVIYDSEYVYDHIFCSFDDRKMKNKLKLMVDKYESEEYKEFVKLFLDIINYFSCVKDDQTKEKIMNYILVLIFLCVQGLIPIRYFYQKISGFKIDCVNEIIKVIKKINNKFKIIRFILYDNLKSNEKINKLIINPYLIMPKELQFLIVVHLEILEEEKLKKLIECLALLAINIISIDDLKYCIKKEGLFILSDFVDCVQNIHPYQLLKSISNLKISKESEDLLFGKLIFNELNKYVLPFYGKSIIESAYYIFSRKVKENINLTMMKYNISELQSIQFFHSYKNCINFIRNKTDSLDKKTELSLKALYGNKSPDIKIVEQSMCFINIFKERCFSSCLSAHKYFENLLMYKMNNFDPESTEYRNTYYTTMKYPFVLRKIVLFGNSYNLSKTTLKLTMDFLNEFTNYFPEIRKNFKEFLNSFKIKTYYCGKSFAVSLHFYFEIDNLILKSSIKNKDLMIIANDIFTQNFLSKSKNQNNILHLDISCLGFISALKKSSINEINVFQHLSECFSLKNEEFLFEVTNNRKDITIRPIINIV